MNHWKKRFEKINNIENYNLSIYINWLEYRLDKTTELLAELIDNLFIYSQDSYNEKIPSTDEAKQFIKEYL